MFAVIRPAIVLFILLTIMTGVIYPAIVTGIAKVAFRSQAEGSIIAEKDKEIGSSLIAQQFTDARYFWPRPSAASYDATAGSGSNLGPTNPAQMEAVRGRVDALRAADAANTAQIPVDLVTASASGLDPHISPAAAAYQVGRVAAARNMAAQDVAAIVAACTESRSLALLGEPRVNVLRLNVMLDDPRRIMAASNPPPPMRKQPLKAAMGE